MLKPGEDRVSILANRTLAIIGQDDGKFLVSVTDRDYKYDPSGGKQDILFEKCSHHCQKLKPNWKSK